MTLDDVTSDAVLRGRCLCGAIRYELTPPTAFVSHCHCETCRRAHAAPFVTWTKVPSTRLALTGTLTAYESSPGVTRSFCGRCGTQMTFVADRPEGTKGEHDVYVPLATLVDAPDQLPDSHVSWEEHAPWIEGQEHLPRLHAKTAEPSTA